MWSSSVRRSSSEPSTLSGNNAKIIKSRCGHRIIFDDKEGAEKIGYSFASFITAARVSESNRKPKDSSRSSTGETRARWPADFAFRRTPRVPVKGTPNNRAYRRARPSSRIASGSSACLAIAMTSRSPRSRSAASCNRAVLAMTRTCTQGRSVGSGSAKPRTRPSASSAATPPGTTIVPEGREEVQELGLEEVLQRRGVRDDLTHARDPRRSPRRTS